MLAGIHLTEKHILEACVVRGNKTAHNVWYRTLWYRTPNPVLVYSWRIYKAHEDVWCWVCVCMTHMKASSNCQRAMAMYLTAHY